MRKVIKSVRGGTRIYDTNEQREEAIKNLRQGGWTYIFTYRDVNGFGLQYGNKTK